MSKLYRGVRPLLFALDAERSHDLTLSLLQYFPKFLFAPQKSAPRQLMGITFPNPIGLAAGLDKNADYLEGLAKLGFGFIEVGTVTPKPQPGNDKPRLFRLPEAEALINRFGFNSKGAEYVAERLNKTKYQGILGINIGKNKTTPLDTAVEDYLTAMRVLYEFADYLVINVSSPNTPDLRHLQFGDYLKNIIVSLQSERERLHQRTKQWVPLLLKIAPDLSQDEIAVMASLLNALNIDGVIATNATIARPGLELNPLANEAGGLSGRPLRPLSTQVIQQLRQHLSSTIPIIGVGGILSSADAQEKLAAGADLLQVYTGLIYRGPGLLQEIWEKMD